MRYAKPERIYLEDHPELNERWVQERIAEDTSLLSLGDLVLKDKERIQPHAGRLDLLCQDAETTKRPKKDWLRFEPRLERSDEIHAKPEHAGFDVMEYDSRWGRYRIRLTKADFAKAEPLVRELLSLAYAAGED